MFTYTYNFNLKEFTDSKDATPESLRSAAKVLEEKAKELDKPVGTEALKSIAEDQCIGYISYGNSPCGTYRHYNYRGELATNSVKYKKIVGANTIYNFDYNMDVKYITMIDEDGDAEVYIDIDYV